ncbi:Os05g0357850 [Oryza sativa Japonica Group]|uniref:Os05g0357850 protein n=2 Tax=Oryza TaxID=4527 RepID=C7J2Z5_ORYSJ|nr:Os05g0357850 [Oryza sativa Japonica Group]|eukprot:NP_001174381.1 Os05g0357850 [Oryza sativa Japonica Group]
MASSKHATMPARSVCGGRRKERMIIHMHPWYSLRMILRWQWFSRKIKPDNLGILSHRTFQFGHSGGTILLFSIFWLNFLICM